MASSSAKIRVEFIGKDRSLGRTFASTWKKADTLSKKLTLVAGGLQSFGKAATKYLTLPLLAIGALSVKVAADFDKAMTESTAIMGNVSGKLRKEMEDTARTVAKTTTFTHTEAAESYFYLASAGLSARQSIKALPAVAKFAQAGNFDMARSTDLLTDAQSALGLRVKDTTKNLQNMTRVGDVLVKANVLSNATTEQLSEALTNKAGASLRMLHKDVEEGAAVLAVYANQGLKGAAAGTSLAIVLRDLQKASLKQPAAWDKAGVSVYDASGKMRNMADIIGELEDSFDGLSDKQVRQQLTQLGFTEKSIAATQALIGQSKEIRRYEKDLRNAGGMTDEVAKKQLESFSAKMELLKSKFTDVGITIGTQLMPHLEAFGEWLGKGADWFGGLSEGTQRWALKLGLVLAAIGPVSYVMGSGIKIALALGKAYQIAAKGAMALRAAIIAANAAGVVTGAGAAAGGGGLSAGGKRGAGLMNKGAAGAGAAAGGAAISTAAMTTAAAAVAVAIAPFVVGKIVESTVGNDRTGDGKGMITGGSKGGVAGGGRWDAYKESQKGLIASAQSASQAIAALGAKAATATGKQFDVIRQRMTQIQTLVESGFDFGDINAKHTDAQLRGIRDRIQGQLGITRKRADAIMASMFKDWRPQPVVMGKVNPAMAAAERRIAKFRAIAAKQTKFGSADVTSLLNQIGSVTDALNSTTSAARTAASAITNMLLRKQGATGGGKFEAYGGSYRLRQATTFTAGEAGGEIAAFFPLNNRSRSQQVLNDLMAQLGDAFPSGGSSRGSSASSRGSAAPQVVHAHINLDGMEIASYLLDLVPDAADVAGAAFAQRNRELARGY